MPKSVVTRRPVVQMLDPRVTALVLANAANGWRPRPEMGEFELPNAYRAVGYIGVANLIGTVSASGVRNYWNTDLKRGYSNLLPPPDTITYRGDEALPGWLPETILEWRPYRVGSGNHTSGAERRGNTRGRGKRENEPVGAG